eukprot:CAMPEP_0115853346 /NCGR_PEP_ID=MMETSP0287-20121206/13457_1 /TAXON_ID=412157 /ORGANISM="Chrysochromulina rotalis, Strain UIO044" /LENGTH=114 /DNA_ID=CAMNT_0003307421 /DNA_START=101 /DNA_END=445 /DNA_ORIENTATION=+
MGAALQSGGALVSGRRAPVRSRPLHARDVEPYRDEDDGSDRQARMREVLFGTLERMEAKIDFLEGRAHIMEEKMMDQEWRMRQLEEELQLALRGRGEGGGYGPRRRYDDRRPFD